MPEELTKNFRRKRLMSPGKCAAKSFRMKKIKGGMLVVCCPRGPGHWKRGRCHVGMRAQARLTPRR